LFFKKKVDPHETEEVLTHRYKLWHDYLVRIIGENYGPHTYTVIKTDQLVGLFSCIFVRTTDVDRVFDVDSTSVKTGLKVMNKSIHGNKGGIAIRFVYDHSSLCFVSRMYNREMLMLKAFSRPLAFLDTNMLMSLVMAVMAPWYWIMNSASSVAISIIVSKCLATKFSRF